MDKRDIRAVIMGGGPAGLAAGKVLTDHGVKTVVLEAADGVGGLSRTHSHNGFLFDLGGHRFFTKKAELDQFLHKLMVDELINVDRFSKIYFMNKYFNYPPTFLNAFSGLGPVMSARIFGSFVLDKWKYRNQPAVTLEDWMIQQFGRRMYEIFFKTYTEKVWGVPCTQVSAAWAAQRIKGMSMLGTIKESLMPGKKEKPVSLIGNFKYPAHGIGRISERLAQEIRKGNEIKLRARAVGVLHQHNKVTGVRVRYGDGREEVLEGTHALSSIPVTELIMILDPPAPEDVKDAARKLRYRDLTVVAIMFNRDRITEDTWIYIPDPRISFGRLHEPTNWSPAMSPPGKTSLVFEYFCFETDPVWTMPDEDLAASTLQEFAKIELAPGMEQYAFDHCVVRARKAYPMHDIGHEQHLEKIKSYLEGIENLVLMGRYGQFVYNNMDHSIETGIRAAQRLTGEESGQGPVIKDEYLEMKYEK
ncbi:MAG TPA: FAD-dependent oxidoreductase [bacterium]|nr:FAD-dependent oxidoreductase [bacterium]